MSQTTHLKNSSSLSFNNNNSYNSNNSNNSSNLSNSLIFCLINSKLFRVIYNSSCLRYPFKIYNTLNSLSNRFKIIHNIRTNTNNPCTHNKVYLLYMISLTTPLILK